MVLDGIFTGDVMIYAVIPVRPDDPNQKYLEYRRRRFKRRMELMGLRSASIEKYLRQGFPGPFTRAIRSEMERFVLDIKYRARLNVKS